MPLIAAVPLWVCRSRGVPVTIRDNYGMFITSPPEKHKHVRTRNHPPRHIPALPCKQQRKDTRTESKPGYLEMVLGVFRCKSA